MIQTHFLMGRYAAVVALAAVSCFGLAQFGTSKGAVKPSGSFHMGQQGTPNKAPVMGSKGQQDSMDSGVRNFSSLNSPPPLNSFQALIDTGTASIPDSAGAVGINDVMAATNSQVRTQSKLGFIGFTSTLNQIFLSNGAPVCSNPRLVYNTHANRWVLIATANAGTATSGVVVAVTRTNDPNGLWDTYRINSQEPGALSLGQIQLGFSSKWVVITTNNFSVVTGNFISSSVWAIDSAKLFAASPMVSFTRLDSTFRNLVPAYTYDGANPNLWLCNVIARNDAGQGKLGLFVLTGAVGSEILTKSAFEPAGPAWQETSATDLGPQSGTTTRIDLGDDRVQNLVQRGPNLYLAHTVFLPSVGTINRAAVQWWEIDLGTGVKQRALIESLAGTVMYAFPSIAVDATGNMLVGFSRFSGTTFVNAGYAFRRPSDPIDTIRVPFRYKDGEAIYVDLVGGRNAWGRYSTTVVDPVNGLGLWTLQQYAASPANTWGVWWAQVPVANSDAGNTIVFQGAATTPIVGWKLFNAEYDSTISIGTLPNLDTVLGANVDINNDGFTDLILFNAVTRVVSFELLDANRNVIGSGTIGVAAAGWNLGAAGKFGPSGDATLVWQNNGLQLVVGWNLNSSGNFVSSRIFGTSGASFRLAGAADMNNDGNTDLIYQGPGANQQVVAWLLDANGNFVSSTLLTVIPSAWTLIGAGDFTNDSIADLAIANLTTRLVVVFTGNSPGVFTQSTLVGGYTATFVPRTVGKY